jgi:ribosomal-protein-alanine N-acetyltransferase
MSTSWAPREVVFDTPRLTGRRLDAADIDAMFAIYGDAVAMRWVGDGEPITREGCVQWVEVTHANYDRRGYGMFALEDKGSGQVVGFCGIVHPNGQAEPEVKYALLRSRWGQGLATEAVRALMRYGVQVHGLTHVIATTAPANTASHHVLLKAGLQRGALRLNDDGSHTQLFAWHAAGTDMPR